MTDPILQVALDLRANAARGGAPPSRQFQELWFALARRKWTSVVLVPVDANGSAAALATSLAEVGRWLRDGAGTAIVPDRLDYASAGRIAAIVSSTRQSGSAPAEVIVAVQPVIVEPLGLTVTRAADAVILCIELGRTRLAAVRRTIELIGRERVAGCFLIT
jgi:hypothetical protein